MQDLNPEQISINETRFIDGITDLTFKNISFLY